MSSNRPSTVVSTHTHIKPQNIKAVIQIILLANTSETDTKVLILVHCKSIFMCFFLMIDVCNLSPCSWRNAAVGWRAHTAESCVRRSGLPVQIIHTYPLVSIISAQSSPQTCSSSCFNLHLTFDRWMLTPAEPCSPSTMNRGYMSHGDSLPHPVAPMKTCNLTCHKRMVLPGPVSKSKLDTGSSFPTTRMWEGCTANVNLQGNANISNKC